MYKLLITILFFIMSMACLSCSTIKSKKSSKKSEPIFIIHNYGRVHEPISVNYFGLSNIDKVSTGCDKKRIKRCVTVYMKDGVQIISFNEFLKRNGLKVISKQTYPIYLDTTLVTKPHKLIFVASQKFKIDSIYHRKNSNSPYSFILRISTPTSSSSQTPK